MDSIPDDAMIAQQVIRENRILSEKIAAALDCQEKDAAKALREVLRFLYLVANHDAGMLTPSHRVDLAWHEFILCTRVYRDICNSLFGRYIDHHPGGSKESNLRQYQATLRFYQATYGLPDPAFWSSAQYTDSSCGGCEAV